MENPGQDREGIGKGPIRAIATFSGGLDSLLAALLVARCRIDTQLLHVQHLFSANEDGRRRIAAAAARAGLPLIVEDVSEKHLEVIRRPAHGRGAGMNPCIDCRIFMLTVARRVMEREGADFVVTGEVLGQRPMSQHRSALETAAAESGLGDRLLRPLSANVLPDALPVKRGWLRREDLLDIQGRGRGRQMALAQEFGITEYPQPAGGCLLIEAAYAARLRDAFDHGNRDAMGVDEFRLLGIGRHFRLSGGTKLVVGRNERENEALAGLANDRIRIEPLEAMGPTALVEGTPTEDEIALAARITARYSDHTESDRLAMNVVRPGESRTLVVRPLDRDDPRLTEWRIDRLRR